MREPITEITDEVIDAYRHGLCYDLALELHHLTGLPLAVLVQRHEQEYLGHGLCHAALLVGDQVLDVAGYATLTDTLSCYAEGDYIEPARLSWRIVNTADERIQLERELFGPPDEVGCGDPYEARHRQRAAELASLVLAAYPIAQAA